MVISHRVSFLGECDLTASIGFNSWKRSYICITRKGWIFCTKCIYDSPEECDVKVDLKSQQTRIGAVAADGIIYVTYNNNTSLYMKFPDTSVFSSWLRQLSDFSINTAQKEGMKEAVVKQGEKDYS
jgi:hypothetical protein